MRTSTSERTVQGGLSLGYREKTRREGSSNCQGTVGNRSVSPFQAFRPVGRALRPVPQPAEEPGTAPGNQVGEGGGEELPHPVRQGGDRRRVIGVLGAEAVDGHR